MIPTRPTYNPVLPPRPFLELRTDSVVANYKRIIRAFGDAANVYFALKANNHPEVVRVLAGSGSGFDVATEGEVLQLADVQVRGRRMLFSNPVKTPHGIAAGANAGITRFAVDCEDELDKIAGIIPGAEVYVRVAVPNTGSGWPLSKKFGTDSEGALALFRGALARDLVPIGLTFHVGSQCTNAQNWVDALEICAGIWEAARRAGIDTLSFLDLGGGFPAPYRGQEDAPTPEAIASLVTEALRGRFEGLCEIAIEPGRYLVAEAGTLHTHVTAVTKRWGQHLVFLDTGAFNGMMETQECFWHPVRLVPKDDERRNDAKVVLMGPSCDSVDVLTKSLPRRQFPMPLPKIGDQVAFDIAGAYTNSYKAYNGLAYPEVRVRHAASEEAGNLVEILAHAAKREPQQQEGEEKESGTA